MSGREDNRLFVGGLAWETSERQLEDAFGRYGKITECLVVADRETGRSRGFGFVTYSDHRSMDTAIRDMHGCELDGRVISVNKAKPKQSDEETRPGYGRDYIPGGGRRVAERFPGGTTDCYKCGRPGHFARECPMGDSSGHFREISDRRGDRIRMDPYDRRDSRYGERYGPVRDSYSEGYGPPRETYADERYADRTVQNAYGRERGYFRDGGPRPSGERFGNGGPDRYERGSYRERVGPYDRPRRDQVSSYDRY